jgi:hypothetical protein
LMPTVGSGGGVACQANWNGIISTAANAGLACYNGADTGSGSLTPINFTSGQPIDVKFQWGTLSASNIIGLVGGYGEYVG